MFPNGAAGIALVILRVCAAGLPFLTLPAMAPGITAQAEVVVAASLVCLLLAGWCTPLACVASIVLQIGAMPSMSAHAVLGISLHIAVTICVLLLGPGAYSIDARRYGRRLIFSSRD